MNAKPTLNRRVIGTAALYLLTLVFVGWAAGRAEAAAPAPSAPLKAYLAAGSYDYRGQSWATFPGRPRFVFVAQDGTRARVAVPMRSPGEAVYALDVLKLDAGARYALGQAALHGSGYRQVLSVRGAGTWGSYMLTNVRLAASK